MFKLGYTPSWHQTIEASQAKKKNEGPPIYYPSFGVEGEPAKKLIECCDGHVGEVVEVTVKLKITGVSQDTSEREGAKKQENCRISFEVHELNLPEFKAETKEDDAAEAMDRHRKSYK